MIPQITIDQGFELPDDAHLPAPEEIDEEGYGYFRGVWVIGRVSRDEAREVLSWEQDVVAAIDGLANSVERFDELAHIVEDFEPDDDNPLDAKEFRELSDHERLLLRRCLDSGEELMTGVDLGVAGLALTLAATGFMPVASCRGHAAPHAWSTLPTVFFAGDHDRIALLEDVVIRSGCHLSDGSGNGAGLVVVQAPSVLATMELADAILNLDLPSSRRTR